MWHIYGKKYNLSTMVETHPGGKEILLKTRDGPDLTALFESYHAFSDIDKIRSVLAKYEMSDDPSAADVYDFSTYHELAERVRAVFPNRASIKAPISWWIQTAVTLAVYIPLFYYVMFSVGNLGVRSILSGICGIATVSLGFTAMHDGSHYAIVSNPAINQTVSRIWNNWALWNANIWFHHHVLHHHSFTGNEIDRKNSNPFDPDLYHLYPLANKTTNARRASLYVNAFVALFEAAVFPGMFFSQGLIYLRSLITGKLFHIKMAKNQVYYHPLDMILMSFKYYCLYRAGFLVALSYILSANVTYAINIFFDHDTYETLVENHYTGKDWARLQIQNSGNFLNGSIVWTRLFGGINYQIEHHLFPNMSHVHYPTIAPIVRQFCEERGIPYVHHPTLISAFRSYVKMLRERNETTTKLKRR